MEKCIKQFKGHSGCKVFLMERDGFKFVKKTGLIERNLERLLSNLRYFVRLPVVFRYDECVLEMQYVHGVDMNTYLLNENIGLLERFLEKTLYEFAASGYQDKDYFPIYEEKLKWMDTESTPFPFTKDQLLERLPRVFKQSVYHGDFTLENILYDTDFCAIDPVTIEYDSYIFDVAKLRQDLECGWFTRHSKQKHSSKLGVLRKTLQDLFPEAMDDHLLILMLLRVYRHCEPNTLEYDLVVKEINRLWKS